MQLPGFRSWSDDWTKFATAHADWLKRINESEPIYTLPEAIVTVLAKSTGATPGTRNRAKKAMITPQDVEAERAFLKLCQGWGPYAVGVWSERPIQHQWLMQTDDELIIPPEYLERFRAETKRSPAQFESWRADEEVRTNQMRHQFVG